MAFVFYAHSGLRYLVLLAAFAALAYLLAGLVRGIEFNKLARILTGAYTGFLDLQVLLGVVLWLLVPSYPALIGHIVMMLAAATAAHMGSVLNKRRETPNWSAALAGVTISLILIVGGIMAIGRPLFGSGAPTG